MSNLKKAKIPGKNVQLHDISGDKCTFLLFYRRDAEGVGPYDNYECACKKVFYNASIYPVPFSSVSQSSSVGMAKGGGEVSLFLPGVPVIHSSGAGRASASGSSMSSSE